MNTANSAKIVVKEQNLLSHDGLIKGNKIAIRKNIETQKEKSCVLAEELGHYYTSSGDILDQSKVETANRNTGRGSMVIISRSGLLV